MTRQMREQGTLMATETVTDLLTESYQEYNGGAGAKRGRRAEHEGEIGKVEV